MPGEKAIVTHDFGLCHAARAVRPLSTRAGVRGWVSEIHHVPGVPFPCGARARLERWATPRLTLVVGGPLGLHRKLLERADGRWSLSPLTFPHELVRGLVAEQLYRALTILRRVPYHK